MLILNSFIRDFGHKTYWHYARKGNVMLSVYIISVVSAILFSLSLRSFWVGVLGFVLVISACDTAVYYSGQAQYVGPVLAAEVVVEAIDSLTQEIAIAERKAEEYNKCVSVLENKVWNVNQTIPSHRWIHSYCKQQ